MNANVLRRLFSNPQRPSRRQRRARRPGVERLEDRCTPASLYVDDTFAITTDTPPPGLSTGDTVTWDPGQPGQVTGLIFGTDAFSTIHDAVAAANTGDTINVAPGTYLETQATTIPDSFVLSIVGAGAATTLVQAGFDSGDALSGDARAWFLISANASLDVSGMTLDGNGHLIGDTFRYTVGSVGGNADHVAIKNITLLPTDYDGYGFNIKSGTVNVTNSTFTNIGRIGAQYTNAGTVGNFLGNTYTGKGAGDHIDYMIEVGDGANVIISGNTVTGNNGVASADGTQSAGILVDTAFAPGTQATIIGNQIASNLNGIFVGISDGDGDTSSVVAQYNNIVGNGEGVHSTDPTVDADNNWWGNLTGPFNATNNPTGLGDSVTDNVTFAGFSTSSKQIVSATSITNYLNATNDLYATGAGPGGGPHVKVFNSDGSLRFEFMAYPVTFTGGVHTATGDVNGDGVQDIITGAGGGGAPQVKVFDGATGLQVRAFMAYNPAFTGGVWVAAGDVNADGFADIITGAGPGGGPHVRVFDGVTNAEITGFMAYDDAFAGGVRVAAGDFNNDGHADVVTGAGAGGGPHVKVVDVNGLALLRSFFAFNASFTGGVFVSAGDTTGDLQPDVVVGAGINGNTRVHVYDFGNALFQSFVTFAGNASAAVRVGGVRLNGNASYDILAALSAGNPPTVKTFDGRTEAQLASFSAYDPAFLGGVFVG